MFLISQRNKSFRSTKRILSSANNSSTLSKPHSKTSPKWRSKTSTAARTSKKPTVTRSKKAHTFANSSGLWALSKSTPLRWRGNEHDFWPTTKFINFERNVSGLIGLAVSIIMMIAMLMICLIMTWYNQRWAFEKLAKVLAFSFESSSLSNSISSVCCLARSKSLRFIAIC